MKQQILKPTVLQASATLFWCYMLRIFDRGTITLGVSSSCMSQVVCQGTGAQDHVEGASTPGNYSLAWSRVEGRIPRQARVQGLSIYVSKLYTNF